jgi:hypothetical protein
MARKRSLPKNASGRTNKRSKVIDTNDYMSLIPNEVLIIIFGFLGPNSVALCNGVNRTFKLMANDPKIWKYSVDKYIGVPKVHNREYNFKEYFLESIVQHYKYLLVVPTVRLNQTLLEKYYPKETIASTMKKIDRMRLYGKSPSMYSRLVEAFKRGRKDDSILFSPRNIHILFNDGKEPCQAFIEAGAIEQMNIFQVNIYNLWYPLSRIYNL